MSAKLVDDFTQILQKYLVSFTNTKYDAIGLYMNFIKITFLLDSCV